MRSRRKGIQEKNQKRSKDDEKEKGRKNVKEVKDREKRLRDENK